MMMDQTNAFLNKEVEEPFMPHERPFRGEHPPDLALADLGREEAGQEWEGPVVLAARNLMQAHHLVHRDDNFNCSSVYDGKHLPNLASHSGEPCNRMRHVSNARTRPSSRFKNFSHDSLSATILKLHFPMCPSSTDSF